MVFSSIPFLFFFFPMFLFCYFVLPKQCRNYVLLFFSLVFYGWGEPIYVLLMMGVAFSDYCIGRKMAHYALHSKQRKACLIFSVVIDLTTLCVFKYTDFLLDTVNQVFRTDLLLPKIALPIGISFFVFQSLSYTIDLYRGEVSVEKSYPDYLTYVSMFPQLIAGPIVRFSTVREELHTRVVQKDAFFSGGSRFLCGLFKKVLLANQLGKLWDLIRVLPQSESSVAIAWLGAASFTLQLYLDFSAYSDMAIGLGRMLGFHFPENFTYPLAADSVTEFWRRWHISLSTWFRDYVYIPLGGNRCRFAKHLRNLLLVWFLTGLWHGASWNYVLWGVYYGVLLCLEKFVFGKALKKLPGFVRHLYLLAVVVLGFTVFAIEDMRAVGHYLLLMFGGNGRLLGADLPFYLKNFGVVLLFACLISMPVLPKLLRMEQEQIGFFKSPALKKAFWLVTVPVGLLLFLLTVANLAADTYNPFLYFRF